MRLEAALSGSLEQMLRAEVSAAERAVTEGVRAATSGAKHDLREQVERSGLGRRLANTWRDRVYPTGRASIGAAGLVYTRAETIMRAHAEGAVIRGRDGGYLAIPLPAAGRGDRGRKITPGEWERIHGRRLRYVYRRGAPGLLVADDARLTSRGRAAARRGRGSAGRATVPVFVLVPQVQSRKRLDVPAVAVRWRAQLPDLIARSWPER